ncbi:MAG: hypothetical protein KDB22_23470 [Planctomycetales bacterium]|nr:hypothetical protein [Planctomycetales bacterium]
MCLVVLQLDATAWGQDRQNLRAASSIGFLSTEQSVFLSEMRQMQRSEPGGTLGSATIDPFMSSNDEVRILRFLNSWDDDEWQGRTLEQLAAKIGQRVPTHLQRIELEAIAVDPEQEIEQKVPAGKVISRLKTVLEPHDLTPTLRGGYLCITSTNS